MLPLAACRWLGLQTSQAVCFQMTLLKSAAAGTNTRLLESKCEPHAAVCLLQVSGTVDQSGSKLSGAAAHKGCCSSKLASTTCSLLFSACCRCRGLLTSQDLCCLMTLLRRAAAILELVSTTCCLLFLCLQVSGTVDQSGSMLSDDVAEKCCCSLQTCLNHMLPAVLCLLQVSGTVDQSGSMLSDGVAEKGCCCYKHAPAKEQMRSACCRLFVAGVWYS
jgi:hypothetical protein